MAFIIFPSHIIARRFELHTLMLCFPWVFQIKFLFTRKRYHNLINLRMLLHTMAILGYHEWLAWNQTIVCSYYDSHITINFYGTFFDCKVFIYDFLWFSCFLFGCEPGTIYFDIKIFREQTKLMDPLQTFPLCKD